MFPRHDANDIQGFAVWELAFIARDHEDRRKLIYEDIDRKDGPMWSQVFQICLDIVKSMEARIDSLSKKPPSETEMDMAKKAQEEKEKAKEEAERKKRNKFIKEDPIFVSTPDAKKKSFIREVEAEAKKAGTAGGQTSPLRPIAEKAYATAKEQIAKGLGSTGEDPHHLVKNTAMAVLNSPVGGMFRQEYNRYVETIVLGSPYGEPSLYINAIYALAQFSVHSLNEDKYGNVQRDVATIIRTLTTLTRKVEKFKKDTPNHWTDVKKDRKTPEVDQVLTALREALNDLVSSFEPYARDLRLSLTDVRLAKEAAALPELVPADHSVQAQREPEMRQVR